MTSVQKLKQASEKKGLLLNPKKTKIVVLDPGRSTDAFHLDGQEIEEVESFEYLGSLININSESSVEIKRRLSMARNTTQNMSNIWRSRGVSVELKLRLLRASVFSIAMYGCESWAPTKSDFKRIDAFELWCYRRLLRVSWKEKKTNSWVLERIGSGLILNSKIRERKLRYFGHIKRKNYCIEKQIIQGKVRGKRSRGRPKRAWSDSIRALTGGSLNRATCLAQDRVRWRTLVKTTATSSDFT